MNQQKQDFIEQTGLTFEQMGTTRMAGRVMGYLFICDKDLVSSDEISNALQASKGSISGTMKQLIQIGFAEQAGIPGDRKTYYRIANVPAGELLKMRLKQIDTFLNTVHRGLELKEREDSTTEWMIETAAFYAWTKDKIEEMIESWEEVKDEIVKKYRNMDV